MHRRATAVGLGTWLCIAAVAAGCSRTADDPRQAWLRSTLATDNYPFAQRSPELTAGKFRKMALGPYNFFRGTAMQFTRDMFERPGRFPTQFGTPEASRVVVVGDPHYENMGTYLAEDGTVRFDFNDFDASSVGPFHLDARRLALSFYVALVQVDVTREADRRASGAPPSRLVSEAQRVDVASRVAEGYVDEIARLLAGEAPLAIRYQAGFGALVDDIMRRAIRDGEVREELGDYTRVVEDQRRVLVLGDRKPERNGVIGDRLAAPLAAHEAVLRRGWDSYRATLAQPGQFSAAYFRVKDVAQRFGAGVSSYPLLRFYVLVEGASESNDDDVLLEVKEVGDPVAYPTLLQFPFPRFESNAERVAVLQRELQESAGNDPLLGWLDGSGAMPEDFRFRTSSSLGFRIRNRTKYQKGMDVGRLTEKLDDGDWSVADVETFAHLGGRLLASRHAVARIPGSSADPLKAIGDALDGRGAAFVAEMRAFLESYGPVVVGDYFRFLDVLDRTGPLLGIRVDPRPLSQE